MKGQTGQGKSGFTSPKARRAQIVRALKDCPAGKWIDADDFIVYMIASGYDFVVTRDEWSLYVNDPRYDLLGNAIIPGRFFKHVISSVCSSNTLPLSALLMSRIFRPPELGAIMEICGEPKT